MNQSDTKPFFNVKTGEEPLAIIARAQRALRKSGAKESYITEFTKEALSSDYDHLIETIFKYFSMENEDEK